MKIRTAWNKGRKFPHTKEWEQNRLSSMREARKRKVWPMGYKRPESATKPMRDALARWRLEHPDEAKAHAVRNLPKDCNGSKNGNWKGGITIKQKGIRMSSDYQHWRDQVLSRDGHKCRECGGTDELEVHHIISMLECPLIATLPMNGVTLCRKCHYDNDQVWKGERPKTMSWANGAKPLALIFSIPHRFHAYTTVGNWQFTDDGTMVIFVSKMPNWRHEALVAVHELVEVLLCKHDGVTQEQVDQFDMKDFNYKDHPDEEPGDSPLAPYRKQHCIATGIERILAAALGVDWKPYEDELSALPEVPEKLIEERI